MPTAAPALVDREQALAWARAERANLLACLDLATGTGQHARIIALTAGIAALLRHDGPWAEALTRHARCPARRTAPRRPARPGQRPHQPGERAADDRGPYGRGSGLEEALDISRDLGDRLGQANALTNLGTVRRMTGDYTGAARAWRRRWTSPGTSATGSARPTPSPTSSTVRWLAADYPAAAQNLEEALDIYRDLGDRLGQGDALSPWGRCGG